MSACTGGCKSGSFVAYQLQLGMVFVGSFQWSVQPERTTGVYKAAGPCGGAVVLAEGEQE